jgi:hypothetical protein
LTNERLIMNSKKILFLWELQSKVRNECDTCHDSKLLEYLAIDEKGNMFTVCNECGVHLRRIMDAA